MKMNVVDNSGHVLSLVVVVETQYIAKKGTDLLITESVGGGGTCMCVIINRVCV